MLSGLNRGPAAKLRLRRCAKLRLEPLRDNRMEIERLHFASIITAFPAILKFSRSNGAARRGMGCFGLRSLARACLGLRGRFSRSKRRERRVKRVVACHTVSQASWLKG